MRLLLVDDDHAALVIAELKRAGLDAEVCVVATREQLVEALTRGWPAILSDFSLPQSPERRNELERTLRRAEERYRHTFEKAPLGIATNDLSGHILAANQKFCELIGRPAEALIGVRFSEFLPPEDQDAAREMFDEFVASQRPSTQYERRYLHPDGRSVLTHITLTRVTEQADDLDYVVVLAEDVTARKLAKEHLRSSKEQLDDAQSIAGIGSWEYDLATGVRLWSDNLYRMLEIDREGPLDLEAVYARIHPADRDHVREMDTELRAKLRPISLDFRVTLADGALHTLHSMGRPIFDDEGRPLKILGVLQDVTDPVAREQQLHRTVVEQAAVANLGQIALSGASIEFVLRSAVLLIRAVLNVDFSEALQHRNGSFVLVAGDGWDEGVIDTSMARSEAAYTMEVDQPVVVPDLAAERRFTASEFLIRHGVVSGATVKIASTPNVPWGVLGAHSKSPCAFSPTDLDFLRSMAMVIGQALERSRNERELFDRARQQSAIAELGRIVLTAVDDSAFARTAEMVADALDVEYSAYGELIDQGSFVRYHSGRRNEQLPSMLPVRSDSLSGLTILERRPVIIDDMATDSRFSTRDVAIAGGVTSAACVPVASARRTYGILCAMTRQHRQFDAGDIGFMESLANILAEGMERRRAREKLAASEERYRRVVEGASEIIATVDAAGNITSLNSAFETISGWSRKEWIGRNFLGLIPEGERPRLQRMFEEMFQTLRTVNAETPMTGREGIVLIDVVAVPKIRDGAMIGLYAFARDVTEARGVERERQELTRNLQLVLDSTVEGICTVDRQGLCTLINAAAARTLGGTPEEFVGRNLHQLVHARRADGSPYPEADCPIFEAMRTASLRTVSSDVFWRSDGTAIPVEYSAAPMIESGFVAGVVVTFTDVSERRNLEAKLEQADRVSSLGRLAATVAHEFNNVLMGIAPFVEVIRRRPDRTEMALDHIAESIARGKRITQEILRFTRPADPARTVFALEPWLQNAVMEARSMLRPGDVIECSVDDPSLQVDADANQLHQIVTNLIINARDAMPPGGRITIEARREPAGVRFAFGPVDQPDRFVHFSVRDNGTGMSPETLRHIFEPLFTTKHNGTGLGLAVTHQVVQRHGGEIFVESEIGVGTTFHLFIPRAGEAGSPAV